MSIKFDPNNTVIQLCMSGMSMEDYNGPMNQDKNF